MIRWLWLLGIWSGFSSWAQCPDPDQVRQRINRLAQESSSQWLTSFGQLKREQERCLAVADSNYASILFALGYAYSQVNQFDSASACTERSIRINSSGLPSAKPLDLCKAYAYLGQYRQQRQQFPGAIEAYQRSIRYGRQHATLITGPFLAQTLHDLAFLLDLQGDYQEAVEKAQHGFDSALASQDTLRAAQCLFRMGWSLVNVGKAVAAQSPLHQAQVLIKSHSANSQTDDLYRQTARQIQEALARALLADHQVSRGLAQYDQLIGDAQRRGNRADEANLYNNVGYWFLTGPKQYPKALLYFQRAYQRLTDPIDKANTLSNIASVYHQQGRYALALALLQRSLTLFTASSSSRQLTNNPSLTNLRLTLYKDFTLSTLRAKADTWLDWGKKTKSKPRLRWALATYQVADQLIDLMRWGQTGQQSKLYWRAQTHGLYERAIETCYQLGDVAGAYHFNEKSRAVLLADQLNELGARRYLPAPLALEEEQLQKRVTNQQTKLGGLTPQAPGYSAARTALLAAQDQLARFVNRLETAHPAYYQYKYNGRITSLAQVQTWLKKQQQSVVSYFIGDSALYVLSVTPTGTRFRSYPGHVYGRMMQPYMALLTSGPFHYSQEYKRFLGLSNTLYRQLEASLTVPTKRVIVSPDGLFIPFETLSRSARKADYLVHHYAFSYSYSVQMLLQQPSTTQSSRSFVGMAPERFVAIKEKNESGYNTRSFPSLEQSAAVLDRIGHLFNAPTMVTGGEATRRFFQTNAPAARVVQLFTHAEAASTEQSPMVYEPTIFFADTALRLSELPNSRPFTTQLLVLTACKTGIGVNQRGEGVFSLARGFATLGIPSIVNTLWSVEDQPTYRLTELFYQQLIEGVPKDLALQAAKQTYLATASAVEQLPHRWAGIILIGDSHALNEPDHWSRFLIGFFIAGSIVLVIHLRFRSKGQPPATALNPSGPIAPNRKK